MDATTQQETTLRFEREACRRCGGTGSYSYCQMHGSTCFGCGGKKEVLTKRGQAAAEYLKSLRTRPASELKHGDQIKGTEVRAWFTIKSIVPYPHPVRDDLLQIDSTNPTVGDLRMLSVFPDQRYEVYMSPEEQRRTLEAAIAYQSTLTKQGKPRK
jgi:hypothetical protein